MIRQSVNLYVRHEKKRVPFSAVTCLSIWLLVTLLMGGLWLRESMALNEARAQLAAVEAEKARQKQEIADWQARHQKPKLDPALVAERDDLNRRIADRRRFRQLLSSLEPERQLRFSALMQGLADQAVGGLWLTAISASEGGRLLRLEGETGDATLIPRYLRALGESPAYRRASFDNVRVEQRDRVLAFSLDGLLGGGS